MPKLQVITLGCSKNTVDTEHLLFQVQDSYDIVPEGEACPVDVLLINTCGFIGDAKEQSIQTILAAAQRKARQAEQTRRQAERQANEENKAREREIAQVRKTAEEEYTVPAADRKLSGSFEQNRGRLPMPITGGYQIVRTFGSNLSTIVAISLNEESFIIVDVS